MYPPVGVNWLGESLDRVVNRTPNRVCRPELNSQSPCVTAGSDADRCGFIADGQTI
jgi:hypothetical protein